mmetsp:Transcript_46740/g.81314  ORF Transcript_46740/g.81314 Transcript_46740/m.81314 type:complete len:295 (-) Transcript_46740:476-1360(-)
MSLPRPILAPAAVRELKALAGLVTLPTDIFRRLGAAELGCELGLRGTWPIWLLYMVPESCTDVCALVGVSYCQSPKENSSSSGTSARVAVADRRTKPSQERKTNQSNAILACKRRASCDFLRAPLRTWLLSCASSLVRFMSCLSRFRTVSCSSEQCRSACSRRLRESSRSLLSQPISIASSFWFLSKVIVATPSIALSLFSISCTSLASRRTSVTSCNRTRSKRTLASASCFFTPSPSARWRSISISAKDNCLLKSSRSSWKPSRSLRASSRSAFTFANCSSENTSLAVACLLI